MKKLILLMVVGFLSVLTVPQIKVMADSVVVSTYSDGGIAYEKSVDYSQTESLPSCSDPSLYAGQDLTGRYIGWTREFVLGGEFTSFISGDYYYKLVGSIHYIYEIYDYCYVSTERVLSVDLNGTHFYNEDYKGLMWEYDFTNLYQYPYFCDMVGIYDSPDHFLLATTDSEGDWYNIYKTMYVKYDPYLYAELMLMLSYYEALAEKVRDDNYNTAEDYFTNIITTIPLHDVMKVVYKSMADIATGDDVEMEALEAFVGTIKEGIKLGTSIYVTAHYGKTAGEICEIIIKSITLPSGDDQEVDEFIENIQMEDIVSAFAESLAENIAEAAIKKAIGGVTYDIMQAAYYTIMGFVYVSYGNQYQALIDDIDSMVDLFYDDGYVEGRNIRIDYLLDYDWVGSPYGDFDIAAFEEWWENKIYDIEGMIISFTKDDVIEAVINPYLLVDYNVPTWADYHGKITLLSEENVYTEFQEFLSQPLVSSLAPLLKHEEYLEVFGNGDVVEASDLAPDYTLDRNKYYETDTFSNVPHMYISSISKYTTSATIRYNSFENNTYFESGILKIYRGSTLIRTYALTTYNGLKTVTGLSANTLYTAELWVIFDSAHDGGDILLKVDTELFRTLIAIGEPIIVPL